MFHFDEEVLEPIARFYRFREMLQEIPKSRALVIADLGCGPKIRAFDVLQKKGVRISKYYGIDPLISKETLELNKGIKNIHLIPSQFDKKIPLDDNSVDIIISCAVLEHIEYPKYILNDISRVLKKGGKAILTTPSPKAKAILEFLSFKMGLISEREIKEHKNYFTKENLLLLIDKNKNKETTIRHHYFEFGLNNLFIIEQKKQ